MSLKSLSDGFTGGYIKNFPVFVLPDDVDLKNVLTPLTSNHVIHFGNELKNRIESTKLLQSALREKTPRKKKMMLRKWQSNRPKPRILRHHSILPKKEIGPKLSHGYPHEISSHLSSLSRSTIRLERKTGSNNSLQPTVLSNNADEAGEIKENNTTEIRNLFSESSDEQELHGLDSNVEGSKTQYRSKKEVKTKAYDSDSDCKTNKNSNDSSDSESTQDDLLEFDDDNVLYQQHLESLSALKIQTTPLELKSTTPSSTTRISQNNSTSRKSCLFHSTRRKKKLTQQTLKW